VNADVVVIGGGPNGLVAATMLARAGRKVVLLERGGAVGGMAAGFEVEGGLRCAGLLPRALVPEALVREAGLGGLPAGEAPDTLLAEKDGPGLLIPGSLDAAAGALGGQGLGAEVAGLTAIASFVREIHTLAEGVLLAPAPRVQGQPELGPLLRTGLGLRRLGKHTMLELLRLGPTSIEDLLRERLEDERLIAALCVDALPGTWMGPRSPGTSATWLLAKVGGGRQVSGPALVSALEQSARANGVQIQTKADVRRIRLERGRVVGVEAAGLGAVDARTVVSALDPRTTLLGLVAPLDLSPEIERDVRNVRSRGIQAWVLLGLSGALEPGGRKGVRRLLVGSKLNDWERSFDAVKYGALPERPTLDVRVEGEVLQVGVHGVPHQLRSGWSAETRAQLAERVVAQLESVSPGVREKITAKAVIAPPDIEARTGALGGHVYHAELALDQLWVARPTLALSRQSTGIPGLYLASPATHPGGTWTGASGALAARAVMAG